MKEHPMFPWDHYSDQPRILRNKKLKRKIYLRASGQMIKSALLLLLLPIFLLTLALRKAWKPTKTNRCIGLSVHVETECEGKTIVPTQQLKEMVDDLDINHLLVRIPLADSENFQKYINHIDALSSDQREISIHIIQNRIILNDPALLKKTLCQLLTLLKGKVKYIHVGNAYNRRKWAFYHFGEYHRFFQAVRSASSQIAPEMELIGGSVIDFEIPPLLESLFHFRRGHYDAYNIQLYVDRRGAPENKQYGFNLLTKINLIDIMCQYSWKAKGQIWISEINWPLQDTGKFSPCKGSVLTSPQSQADYLVRAYLMAIASGKIRTCFWHQLIAPGYGLVDNRNNTIIKYPSYYALKTLNKLLNNAEIIHYHNGNYQKKSDLYAIKASTTINHKTTTLYVFWSNNNTQHIQFNSATQWINQQGKTITFPDTTNIPITSSPLYALIQK